MKTKITLVVLLIISFSLAFAEGLSYDEIKEAYSKSFEYETKEKYEKAIKVLQDVFEEFSKTYTVNYRLGWLYYLNGNFANSLEHLENAIAANEYSVEAMNTVNLVYVAQEEWEKVEEQSTKIIKIDYYNYYANYYYSLALKMQAKYGLAAKVNKKMLEIFPSSVVFLQELAENIFLNNETLDSKSIFESVLILDPDNTVAPYYLGKFKEEKK
jgi:tetratricopeptide (TPR) repeat protein